MVSPFPGMDPFLEDPDVFPDLHDSMIVYVQEYLQPRLPAPYYAKTRARVWIEVTQNPIEPDICIQRGRQTPNEEGGQPKAPAREGNALRPRPVVVRVPRVAQEEQREPFLEIYAAHEGGDRLVTSLEVLSPSNKAPGD